MRIAILPARGGSQRIKHKNIVDFHGRPIISYPLETAKASGLFDEIHVSTDDQEIADVVRGLGFDVPFMRPSSLAGSHTPVLDALEWVIQRYERDGKFFQTICLLMPASPLVSIDDLKRGVEIYEESEVKAPVLSVAPYPCPTEWALLDVESGIIESEHPEKMSLRSQDLPKKYYDTGNFCIFSNEDLLHRARGTFTRFLKCEIDRHRAVDIDDLADLRLAEKLFVAGRD